MPTDPRAALHTVLSRLRAAVGADTVRTGPAGYTLDVAPDAVDAVRFERLRGLAADRPATEAAAPLDDALGLWRGPAYAEFAGRAFALAEAVRLGKLHLAAREDRAGLWLELGAVEDAVAALGVLVREQPLRERARGLLMAALHRSGRTTEALGRCREYRSMLAEELGLVPSPALRGLEVRILGHEEGAGPPPVPGAGPPAWATSSSAFLARETDAARLVEAVVRHRLVTVTGPGGVGKSRLVAEVLGTLAARLRLPATVVDLAAVRAQHLDAAVADALHRGTASAPPRQSVLEYLSSSALLLVLDGCEHLLPETRSLAQAVARSCSRVRIVVTSRVRLGPAEEQVLPLEPLPVPALDAAPDEASLTTGMRLFTDRLRRARLPADRRGAAHGRRCVPEPGRVAPGSRTGCPPCRDPRPLSDRLARRPGTENAALRGADCGGAAVHRAFALYSHGGVLLAEGGQEAAIPVLRSAAAGRLGAEQIGLVARVALLSVLVRTERRAEAPALVRALLVLQRRGSHWPGLWTTLRILAELLVVALRHEEAHLVLTAARSWTGRGTSWSVRRDPTPRGRAVGEGTGGGAYAGPVGRSLT